MDYLNNNIYLYCNFYSEDLNNIYVIDRLSGKIKNRYRNFKRKQSGVGYSNKVFSKNEDEIYASFAYDFNIYKLNENSYEKYQYIDFNGDEVPESFLAFSDEEREDYIKKHYSNRCEAPISTINDFYISEDLICFRFIRNCLEYTFLLNRINGTTNIGYIMFTEKFPFADSSFLYVIDNQIVMSSLAENVLNTYYKNKSINIKINISDSLINNLQIDDNPVLSIYQLK